MHFANFPDCGRAMRRSIPTEETFEITKNVRVNLADFMAAYNFVHRFKSLSGLSPWKYIAKIWTSELDRLIVHPIH